MKKLIISLSIAIVLIALNSMHIECNKSTKVIQDEIEIEQLMHEVWEN